MSYHLQELFHNLKINIGYAKAGNENSNTDLNAWEADLSWDASRFFSSLIYKAEPIVYYISYDKLQIFKAEYEKLNNTKVDENKLFQKFWVRNILGFVMISGGIRSLCREFKKIKEYKNELSFWLDFQRRHCAEGRESIEKSIIDASIESYENFHDIKLIEEGVYFHQWSSIDENNIVKYSNFEFYFKQYLDYWDDFLFLTAFENYINSNDKQALQIAKSTFVTTYNLFKGLNPKMPSIETLIDQNVIKESAAHYDFDLLNAAHSYWQTLKDKIAGHLWELLLNDADYQNDDLRLKAWLAKIIYWSPWVSSLKYVTQSSIKRFLDAALELVMNESDLEGTANEFAKVCFDAKFAHESLLSIETKITSSEFLLNNSDPYEILVSLDSWEDKAHTTYLYAQESRAMILYLIKIVINNDTENRQTQIIQTKIGNAPFFSRVFSLLYAGIHKPYLIWQVTRFIIIDRPEIIPHLIVAPELEAVAFTFLDNISYEGGLKSELNFELWQCSVLLFLKTISDECPQLKATKIFQLFRSLNKHKYRTSYNLSGRNREIELQKNRNKKERLIIDLIENNSLEKDLREESSTGFLLPNIFEELATVVINYSSQPLYKNGTAHFPILQWDAVSWLLKVSTYWKYSEYRSRMKTTVDRLSRDFLARYLQSIEVTEIAKYNYFEEKEELAIPLWSEKMERLQFVNWIYPIYFINELGLLNQFLSPRINFERTTNRYHETNKFSADKLRTHIGVLLQILRKLLLPILPYGFDRSKIKDIKNRIEKQILDYLKNHSTDNPDESKIDLFDYNREWRFEQSDKEALFPQIARAVNWFSDRDSIINIISDTGDVSKLLTLMDLVRSEGIKQKIIDRIKEMHVQSFLGKYNWIPEIQYAFTNLSKYPELLPQIHDAIAFWKNKVLSKRETIEYKIVLFKAEVLVAYFNKSESEIDNVIEPKIERHHREIIRAIDHKNFYKGLLFLDFEPQKAYEIFSNLVKKYPDYPSFALNRLIAKINMSNDNGNLNTFQEALEEWKEMEKALNDKSLSYLEPDLSVILINILYKIGDFQQVDEIYRKLDLPDRMKPEVIDIITQSLIAQQKPTEALYIIDTAKAYHQFGDIIDIEFLNDLEAKVSGIDNIEKLKSYYEIIFRSEPQKLIQIFPPYLNGMYGLQQFLVKEIVLAADKLLEKIRSIENIDHEDKYNDLIELALDARLNGWGWQIGAQSRGAFSGTGGKQPGERDLPVMNRFKKSMLVCEAFIYSDATAAKYHLQKVFNYYHQRDAFAILVYNKSPLQVFEKDWSKYISKIIPNTIYPGGFEIQNPVKEVSDDYGCHKSAIKVGVSEHGSGTMVYHIFVNINYKV